MMTREQYLPLFGLSLASSLVTFAVGFAVAMLIFAPSSGAAPDPQAPVPVVRAERFELVDANGTVRAVLRTGPPSVSTDLVLNDEHGAQRVIMSAVDSGGFVYVQPAAAQASEAVRRELGLPEALPGDDVLTIGMAAIGPPIPNVGFFVSTRPRVSGADVRRLGMGIGPSDQYGFWARGDDGQVRWQAP